MDEAAVQLLVHRKVVERILPVRVVQVGVATEHLTRDVLAICEKALREAARLAHPVVTGKRRERSVERGRSCRDGSGGAGSVQATGSVSGRSNGGRIGRENAWIVNLADDPLLNKTGVLASGDFDWGLVVVEPGIGVTTGSG